MSDDAYETIEALKRRVEELQAENDRLKGIFAPLPEGMRITPYCEIHKTHWLGLGGKCATCGNVFETTDVPPQPCPPIPSDEMQESGL